VDHAIGVAEALAEPLAHLDAPDFVGIDGVHHDQVVGEHRAVARSTANPQGIQRRVGVGAELDAGADLADVVGLLQQQHLDTLRGQGLGSGEAADAPPTMMIFCCLAVMVRVSVQVRACVSY
jgi:hypothetical protein